VLRGLRPGAAAAERSGYRGHAALHEKGPKAYLAGADLGEGRALVLPEALVPTKCGGAKVGRVRRLREVVWVPYPRRLRAPLMPRLLVSEHGLFVRPFANLFAVPLCELLAVVTLGAFPNGPAPSPCAEPPLDARAGVPDGSRHAGALQPGLEGG